jgi:hypothetical protein
MQSSVAWQPPWDPKDKSSAHVIMTIPVACATWAGKTLWDVGKAQKWKQVESLEGYKGAWPVTINVQCLMLDTETASEKGLGDKSTV